MAYRDGFRKNDCFIRNRVKTDVCCLLVNQFIQIIELLCSYEYTFVFALHHALDLVPKKAAGTAAGFTGLFGYVGGAVSANIVIGVLVDRAGWNAGFALISGACVIASILIVLTWNSKKRALGAG
jgi:sugar phosphate permease